ncbi:MAG: hypothetical protein ACI9NT_001165 [Bacteroidia bacterium]|jgi:hypothetical protein
MANPLDDISAQVSKRRNFDTPPLHLWQPDLSGDIPIRIDREGRWYHEEAPIERESLVRLFASILRREDDGEYYLVTPVEKWRIEVELYPLMVIDINKELADTAVVSLEATLNTGKIVPVNNEHGLFMVPEASDAAAIRLSHGLSALFTRSAWYRLVDMAQTREGQVGVESDGQWFPLAAE